MKRKIAPGHPHHVVLRGNNRRRLFSFEPDYKRFLWYLTRALVETECLVYALALMSNHVHMILYTPDHAQLAWLIKDTAQRYAVYRNRRFESTGKLYEQKYYAKPILDETQLALSLAYVEANAVRHKVYRDPITHRWSTYRFHIGAPSAIPPQLWTPTEWFLNLGNSPEARAAHYAEWVADCIARGRKPDDWEYIEQLEAASLPYDRRIVRPNGSCAMEPTASYGDFSDSRQNTWIYQPLG